MSSLSTGAIIGIAVGAAIALVLIIGFVVAVVMMNRSDKKAAESSTYGSDSLKELCARNPDTVACRNRY
jgi:mannose/fructose/N-acetylgalactosamine-specific phosphotransferase system component IIC